MTTEAKFIRYGNVILNLSSVKSVAKQVNFSTITIHYLDDSDYVIKFIDEEEANSGFELIAKCLIGTEVSRL